jgi:Spy/CpxP family protein refolding chaperone
MTRKFLNRFFLILLAIGIVGFGANTYADYGPGYRHHGRMHHGPGWHHRGYGGPGGGYWGNLSEEQLKQLNEEREAFFQETESLRRQIYQKGLELRSELAKENSDPQKASEIQTELSDLKAQLAQKRLDNILKMKKIVPGIGGGGMDPYGLFGPGIKDFDRMGPGRYGRGYGPNCPYGDSGERYGLGRGMMGRGYGMGPGMMGPRYGREPGMMGRGWSRGKGPGGSGRDYPQQYRQGKGPLEEKDARAVVEDYIQSTRNPNLKLGKIEDTGEAFKVEIVTKDNSIVDEVLVDKSGGWMRPAY